MINTIIYIGGKLSGRAENILDVELIDRTILRDFTEYRLAGTVETSTRDELVHVFYANDPLAAVREFHKQCALSFMSTVAVSSSAAVAMTMWLCSIRQYTFCTHTMNEIASDHVDAFCKIILRSKRFKRLAAKGRRDATYSELYHEFMKK